MSIKFQGGVKNIPPGQVSEKAVTLACSFFDYMLARHIDPADQIGAAGDLMARVVGMFSPTQEIAQVNLDAISSGAMECIRINWPSLEQFRKDHSAKKESEN